MFESLGYIHPKQLAAPAASNRLSCYRLKIDMHGVLCAACRDVRKLGNDPKWDTMNKTGTDGQWWLDCE
jgi:hypothetical protein